MKKTIMLLLILIIAGLVLAQEKPLTDKEVQDIAKDPQKLADAIDKGEVSDFTVITGLQLAGALSQKPSIVEKLDNINLGRAVESNSNLLSNDNIYKKFDNSVPGDLSLVNNNPEAKKVWLTRHGIDDKGAMIKEYTVGKEITTAGTHSTSFTPSDFKGPPNPQVLTDGTLVIPAGATLVFEGEKGIKASSDIKISGSTVSTSYYQNKFIFSINPEETKRSLLTYDNKIYASDSPFTFLIDNAEVNNKENYVWVESGDKELKIVDLVKGTSAKLSGNMIVYGDGHWELGLAKEKDIQHPVTTAKYTELDRYNTVIDSITYQPTINSRDSLLSHYDVQGGCAGKTVTCIEEVGNSMTVSSGEYNDLIVKRNDNIITSLNVQKLNAGRLVYNDKGVAQYEVTPGNVVVYGDASKGTDISLTWTDIDNGEKHTQSVSKNNIEQCSICKKTGELSDLTFDVISSADKLLTQNADSYQKFKQDAKNKWNIAPMGVTGYIDDVRENRVVSSLLATSERTGLDINFLTASAFQEGLNGYMDSYYYGDPSAKVNGFVYLGTDNFVNEINNLKQKGYLRQDFNEFTTTTSTRPATESGGSVELTTPVFNNVEYGIEAFGAELKARRDTFLSDAQSMGLCGNNKCENVLTQDQINVGTYLYYNTAPNIRKSILNQRGINFVQIKTAPTNDALINAKRVGATTDLLKSTAIFNIPS